jgi:hypothetical protein
LVQVSWLSTNPCGAEPESRSVELRWRLTEIGCWNAPLATFLPSASMPLPEKRSTKTSNPAPQDTIKSCS